MTRRTILALVAVALVGCSPWSWRLRGETYPPADQPPAVHAGPEGATLSAEAYAIGDVELSGTSMDALVTRATTEGQRHGADAMILMDFETITAHWTAFHTGDTEGSTVHRAETIETTSAEVSLSATGIREPTWCLGMTLDCDAPAGSDDCPVAVSRVVPGGPASAAGIRPGNRLITVGGEAVTHPWDVHQWVDASDGSPVDLTVAGPDSTQAVTVTPVTCAGLY